MNDIITCLNFCVKNDQLRNLHSVELQTYKKELIKFIRRSYTDVKGWSHKFKWCCKCQECKCVMKKCERLIECEGGAVLGEEKLVMCEPKCLCIMATEFRYSFYDLT